MHDLVILGSGPAGLTAALYAARAELAPLVIDGGQPGGQLMITTEVENFPGFPHGIQGPELIAAMRAQVERFGARFHSGRCTGADFARRPFELKLDGETVRTRAVIIATGASARTLGLDREGPPDQGGFMGAGLSACATCDGFFFKGQEVLVVGGGDSAMEEANFLTRFCTRVTVVHRRDKLRASPIMARRSQDNPKIDFLWDTEPVALLGEKRLSAVRLRNVKTGQETERKTGGMFYAIGHRPNTDFLRCQPRLVSPLGEIEASCGGFDRGTLEMDANGYLVVHDQTHTKIPGVFAAGDVRDHRYRQAITAAGMGCMAALDAQHYLETLADA